MMKKKIVIEMDDREGEFQELANIEDLNLEFDRKRLKCGDFIYNRLLIERKDIDDFCSSIMDGRLESQVKKMNEMQKDGYDCFVIIVGMLKDRKVEVHENCILGKINSLVMKHNIKVLWCEHHFHFLWIMRNLCEKHDMFTDFIEIKEDEIYKKKM